MANTHKIRVVIDASQVASGYQVATRAAKSSEAAQTASAKAVVAGNKLISSSLADMQSKAIACAQNIAAARKKEATDSAAADAKALAAAIARIKKEGDAKLAGILKQLAADDRRRERQEERDEAAAKKAVDREERKQERIRAKEEAAALKRVTVQTKVYTQEEAHARALTELNRRKNDALVAAELKAMGVTDRRFKNGWEGANMLASGITRAAGAFGLMTSASGVISYISDQFAAANRQAMEGANLVNDYRESLLELAALKGRLGNSGAELGEAFELRRQTLQSKEDATKFQAEALNVGQSAVDDDARNLKGNISKAEFNKAMAEGGKFQAAEKGDAATHGKLIGMLPSLMGGRQTGASVSAEEKKMFDISQIGGASFSSMAQGFMSNSAYAKTGIISPSRLMATESAFSTVDPQGHAAMTEQFVRATAGGVGKLKGPKVEGQDAEKIGPYLKRLAKASGQDIAKMDPIEIGKLIHEDLTKVEAAGGNPLQHLIKHGYGNMEDQKALLGFHALNKPGAAGGASPFAQFEARAGAKADSGAADKAIAGFQKSEVGASRKAGLVKEGTAVSMGMGAPEYFRSMMTMQFEKMKQDKETYAGMPITGEFEEDIAKASMFNPKANEIQKRVFERSMEALNKEAKRVGAPQTLYKAGGYTPTSTAAQQSALFGARERVGKANGDTMPGYDASMDATKGIIDATNKTTKAIIDARPAPQPLPVGVRAGAGLARQN